MANDQHQDRDGGRYRQGSGGSGNDWNRRPERMGDRNRRDESDDTDYGAERYRRGREEGFGSVGMNSDPDSFFGAPGYDPSFGGPRFDRLDVGSTGTHGVHPVSSPYGADYRGAVGTSPQGGFGSSARRYAEITRSQGQGGQSADRQGSQQQQQGRRHDPHYAQWRNRQIQQLDQDYDEYCRETDEKFAQEFGSWRSRRADQRNAVGRATEHMEVVGSDGSHVGTVDKTRGDRIILTRSDPEAGGHHHSIPCAWVETVDEKVTLNVTAEEARRRWRDEENNRALFERESQGSDGPHMLNRSFSGTYRDEDRKD